MFRAVLLSIVLTLAAGQDAALLCSMWCHPGGEMPGSCEHLTEAASPGLVANDDCAVDANPVVFVREDGRRNVPAPDVAGVAAMASAAFTSRLVDNASAYEPSSRLLFELRPLVLSLRI